MHAVGLRANEPHDELVRGLGNPAKEQAGRESGPFVTDGSPKRADGFWQVISREPMRARERDEGVWLMWLLESDHHSRWPRG